MASPKTLTFKVTRRSPELIPPAKPMPYEFKPLSDVDDQESLRLHVRVIQFYRKSPAMAGRDPAAIIREALAKVLVFYYPFAGRLREGAARKLAVECTGEGPMFIEADADVTLEEFGDAILPPFPYLEEVLYEIPAAGGIINCPLLLIQVTRLKCGGFIFALRLNHTMSDAVGVVQFMTAIGELARGAKSPSVPPVWQRELLSARNPPHVSCTHREFDEVPDTKGSLIPPDDMVHRSFFFDSDDIATLRHRLPPRFRNCSTFDLITACLWRCRTIAISMNPNEEVRIICVVNARQHFDPPLPVGYYGNVIAFPVAISTAAKLSKNQLHYAVDLVRKSKLDVSEEYMKSLADLMVTKGRRPHLPMDRTQSYLVTDVTRSGFEEVDLGWGKAVYGGLAKSEGEATSYYVPLIRNKEGKKGIVVPISLPVNAMEVFAKELEMLLKREDEDEDDGMTLNKERVVVTKSAL